MPVTVLCRKCGRLKTHYAKGLCKTCHNEPYILVFRRRADYNEKNREYQQTHYIKMVLQENEEKAK